MQECFRLKCLQSNAIYKSYYPIYILGDGFTGDLNVPQQISNKPVNNTLTGKQMSSRPRTTTKGDKALEILLSVRENPIQSSWVLAITFMFLTSQLQFYLSDKSYVQLQLVHELNEDDLDRRAEFCKGMMQICNNNNSFARNILFSDEATFNLNGVVNRHTKSRTKETELVRYLGIKSVRLQEALAVNKLTDITGQVRTLIGYKKHIPKIPKK
ncbi:hypothetical protein NQ318_014758 [Aromia moschata]|uniref:PiggyBac transposable element-derived protein domain-containing protein n=1 Tax=Aromia moschata TaxID=1265417 RepID=A0AAV8ZDU4_9CUCU|nr:hypothetical protein NQ318_014758 [Aromia moschata]